MPTATCYADTIIQELGLIGFILAWNNGAGSCIPNFSHFLVALSIERRRLIAYDAALKEAVVRNYPNIEDYLIAKLEPIIAGSAITAILTICDDCAATLVQTAPTELSGLAPFASEETFITWAVENCPTPIIAGPYGEDIIDEDTIDVLLRRALGTREMVAMAVRSGWLTASNHC